jgi:hypothetical protein
VRLWTVHPKYLDAKGLVALWREALLAQKVLCGQTKGYTRHPQLLRFKSTPRPTAAIGAYLVAVYDEASRRGYRFDRTKILNAKFRGKISETDGQLLCEWAHLLKKLKSRDQSCYRQCCSVEQPEWHPLFQIIAGAARDWEKAPRLPKTRTK